MLRSTHARDSEKTATLLDELVALGRAQRCEVAKELRKVGRGA